MPYIVGRPRHASDVAVVCAHANYVQMRLLPYV